MKKAIAMVVFAMFLLSMLSIGAFAKEGTGYKVLSGEQAGAAEENSAGESVQAAVMQKASNAKEKLTEAKEKLAQAKENFEQKRDAFRETKQNLAECTGDECTQLRERIETEAKDYLSNTAGRVISALEKVRARVEGSELSEEESAELLAGIDERIEAVKLAKESAEESEDKAGIIASARAFRKEWKTTSNEMKRTAGILLHSKIGVIITRAEQLETKMEKIANRLGLELGDELGEFSGHIETAKAALENAVKERTAKNYKAMTQYQQEAHAELKEAHAVLKGLVASIKQEQGGEEALETPADELEEEAAEEAVEEEEESAEEEAAEEEGMEDVTGDVVEEEAAEEDSDEGIEVELGEEVVI